MGWALLHLCEYGVLESTNEGGNRGKGNNRRAEERGRGSGEVKGRRMVQTMLW